MYAITDNTDNKHLTKFAIRLLKENTLYTVCGDNHYELYDLGSLGQVQYQYPPDITFVESKEEAEGILNNFTIRYDRIDVVEVCPTYKREINYYYET